MHSTLSITLALAAVTGAVGRKYNTAAPVDDGSVPYAHIITHTHDDVGWLKTVDQYYTGQNDTIQEASVRYIIDTMVEHLGKNPDRRFTYVEQAFFQRWWREQDDDTRDMARQLFQSGQLEFVNGGWCMHDEAGTHYQAMLDQTTLGHRFLAEEFGAYPSVGWQIDPFGHSATNAALLSAEAGFNSLFFWRIDEQDKAKRIQDHTLEMVWRASPSLGAEAQVFTGAFHGSYCAEPCLNFDSSSSSHGVVQDRRDLEDYNVDYWVDLFVNQTLEYYAQQPAGQNQVMLMAGCDFNWRSSLEYFYNLDKLIHYVNLDGRVKARYSTPGIYTSAVHAQNLTWTVKTDDFFPYSDNPHGYWTGYFTSRPSDKGYVRLGSAYLRAASSLTTLTAGDQGQLQQLQQAMGVVQHHDAVSGTSKQHVAFDYYKRIAAGISTADEAVNAALQTAMGTDSDFQAQMAHCHRRNESVCAATTGKDAADGFGVILFNPLSRNRTVTVRVPAPDAAGAASRVVVKDVATGAATTGQAVLNVPIPFVNEAEAAKWSVVFQASLPPLGFSTFKVTWPAAPPVHTAVEPAVEPPLSAGLRNVTNGIITLAFDTASKRLVSIRNERDRIDMAISQEWRWYNSSAGGSTNGVEWGATTASIQNSGAYIFRPNSSDTYSVNAQSSDPQSLSLSFNSGPLVQEVQQVWSSGLVTVYRLTAGADFVTTESTVGPIPIDDHLGKEVVARWTTDIASEKTWYTDSNGREFVQRVRDHRPTFQLNNTEPVAGNYYPVNTAIRIQDDSRAFSVLTDRSEGGASLRDGEVELMVHRRLLFDDARGVGEPLNETSYISPYPNPVRGGHPLVVRVVHTLRLDPVRSAAARFRPQMDELFLRPVVVTVPATELDRAGAVQRPSGSLLRTGVALPENVIIANADGHTGGAMLLRLAHQFAAGEDPVLSQPVTVDVASLFKDPIASITELSLTGNRPASEVHRLTWNTEDGAAMTGSPVSHPLEWTNPNPGASAAAGSTEVTLGPMKVRTFAVVFGP